jgi:hypothetical protein
MTINIDINLIKINYCLLLPLHANPQKKGTRVEEELRG